MGGLPRWKSLTIPQCLIKFRRLVGDQLAMVEALPILVALTPYGANLVRPVLRIRLAQVLQVQQVKRLIQDVLPHQTLLVKQVAQALHILAPQQATVLVNQLPTLQYLQRQTQPYQIKVHQLQKLQALKYRLLNYKQQLLTSLQKNNRHKL